MVEGKQRNPLADLLQGRSSYPDPTSDGLKQLRARAVERANALSVPSTRDEDWRFTDLTPLYKSSFQPAQRPESLDKSRIEEWLIPESQARLVFCDGRFVCDLSDTKSLPGLTVANLRDVTNIASLGRIADFEHDPFVALNTSFLHDAAVIRVESSVRSDAPIHLLFLATQKDAASYPRVFVAAASGARVIVVEDHVSLCEESAFASAVTEIDVEDEASVCHINLQRQSATQFHIGRVSARVARNARFASHTVTLGARLSRNNLDIAQTGEAMECEVDGLALISGRQLADTHSTIDHAKPHGRSRQVHRCIVDGGARAVFNGKILVREGAQLTDASQQSRNLLLSDRARVDTKPQLEIYADDVKCAHGATVGQLEAEELFYLRSRGLSESSARSLLTYAFAAEVIERIPVKSIVRALQKEVMSRTQGQV